ncbi:hypothetical protein NL108_015608 [Boleophthalmus pectinirostris]|uniref:interleukin-13 receptor subunit alpha-1 n=1 Tax=Boleophthalmus pectinirostris TaxID=150288 RepID=UPI00242E52FC|nr:interleukin-13 receptor subunit alpha-1 [Boleophthalmus pectinirostris]KAJ0055912.1 hypothetical protein NL108_015608 [Boleophthalmus pectinirostris]
MRVSCGWNFRKENARSPRLRIRLRTHSENMTGLFLLLCTFTLTSASPKVLPPENVRLVWLDDFYPELWWTNPKQPVDNCKYHIRSTIWKEGDFALATATRSSPPWPERREINGGFLNISIQTVCGNVTSERVFTGLNDQSLGLSCAIKSSAITRCSWKPLREAPTANISFFYDLLDSDEEGDAPFKFRECPRYADRTTCHLRMNLTQQLSVLLKATVGGRIVRNVYQLTTVPLNLYPLNWTIKATGELFHISWPPPEFADWTYEIKYTECSETLSKESSGLSAELYRRPECSYSITMRGVSGSNGDTEWTPEERFDAVPVFNPMLFAVVVIPLLMAALVVLCLLWCMKHKDIIYPKVPQPNPELFKDILNNNIDFFIPKIEEECDVSLVVRPQL